VRDAVTRLLAVEIPMQMPVTQIDDELIHCGPRTFDRRNGAEVDHDLRWGPQYGRAGSSLVPGAERADPSLAASKRSAAADPKYDDG